MTENIMGTDVITERSKNKYIIKSAAFNYEISVIIRKRPSSDQLVAKDIVSSLLYFQTVEAIINDFKDILLSDYSKHTNKYLNNLIEEKTISGIRNIVKMVSSLVYDFLDFQTGSEHPGYLKPYMKWDLGRLRDHNDVNTWTGIILEETLKDLRGEINIIPFTSGQDPQNRNLEIRYVNPGRILIQKAMEKGRQFDDEGNMLPLIPTFSFRDLSLIHKSPNPFKKILEELLDPPNHYWLILKLIIFTFNHPDIFQRYMANEPSCLSAIRVWESLYPDFFAMNS